MTPPATPAASDESPNKDVPATSSRRASYRQAIAYREQSLLPGTYKEDARETIVAIDSYGSGPVLDAQSARAWKTNRSLVAKIAARAAPPRPPHSSPAAEGCPFSPRQLAMPTEHGLAESLVRGVMQPPAEVIKKM